MTVPGGPKKTLLILGARAMQLPAIKTARDTGVRVVVIDPDAAAAGFEFADMGYVYDLADFGRCLEAAKACAVDGVITMGADYPVPVLARLCAELALPGVSMSSAMLSTNKKEMRRAFASASVPSAVSFAVSTPEAALGAVREIGGRAIMKPCLSSGGRGVTGLAPGATEEEVFSAFTRAMQYARHEDVLVEEFIDGPEFSVETVTSSGQTTVVAVTDKLTTGHPYFVEVGHSQPSCFPAEQVASITDIAIRGVQALGIDEAPSHAEIRLGADGPHVIEIGARLGGGFITSHLVPLSTGVDMIRAAISLALGRAPEIRPTHCRGAAVRFLKAAPGVVRKVSGVEAARACAGTRVVDIQVAPGDEVKPLVDATCRVGHVICDADDPVTAVALAENALSKISVETEEAQSCIQKRGDGRR